ncbi:disease resistance protein RPV1-like [Syzygium oleosum]|uniref:disease resistance protein RPV1-like n=1 Tax=Syzygium oleosum TaxID=219896 RepID=UPI0011D2B1F3|nr:disease resistance protein RPV1-like [Syzygium oleosum]XP_056166313.1 disease resistance protein RPV1-like [Syzygium oleosum]
MAATLAVVFLVLGVIAVAVVFGKRRRNRESSSTSTSLSRTNYEVFLSFRGVDTRRGFTDHLYSKLIDAGIEVFKDDENLHAGGEIKPELIEAIKRSRISIAILSKDYASSKSCLMEVVQMWECRKSNGQTIVPIFYDVSPSDVKHQAGDFETSFHQHEKDGVNSNTIKTWKEVLRQIGGLSGYHREIVNGGHESQLVKEVLRRVRQVLKKDDQVVTEKLVGFDLHVQEMMRKLGVVYNDGQAIEVCGQDVRVVGICGMPGVGKTTLAKVVFNKMHMLFDECSFLEGINSKGVMFSQEMLIADLQKEKPAPLKSSDEGTKKIASLFNVMKVLIVLDDVHEIEQTKALAEKLSWFGPGSRIIVTTDVRNVLDGFNDGPAEEYKVEPMRYHHALQLFRKHAFQGNALQDVSDYDPLSIDIVKAIGGLPSAIVDAASYLCANKDDIRIWRETLNLLKEDQGNKVESAFKDSYESLDVRTREIFLDIACFFIGKDVRIPSYMWEACDYYPARGIKRLREINFLEIGENNELRMHDLLRDFGRKLVERKDLHERCRFWNHSDALSILKDSKGTGTVEGIGLTVEEGCTVCFTCEEFHKMSNLRYLRLDRANIQGNTENLLPNLRWLEWRACRLISELGNMHLKKLAILDLSWSSVTEDSRVWRQIMEKVEELKVLNLQGCVQLPASLNFRAPINLEILILEDCTQLSQIGPFISNLKNLSSLNLRKCCRVKQLPQELCCMKSLRELLIDGTGIHRICFPEGSLENLEILSVCDCQYLQDISTIGRLRNLSSLALDGADIDGLPNTVGFLQKLRRLSLRNCWKLGKLPTSIGKLELLEVMDLSYTGIMKMPRSIKDLRNLKTLKMAHTPLRNFPENIVNLENLEEIDFSCCRSLEGEVRCDISGLSSLRILRLSSSVVAGLPMSICHLSRLQTLDILDCDQLRALPKLPSSLLSLVWGSKEMTVPDLSYLTNLKELLLKDVEQPKTGWLMRILSQKTPNMGWITRLPSLETLQLSLPMVTNLPGNFSALTQFRELSLSYMKEPDLTQLSSTSSLSTLRLKHCKIQESKFSSLKYLSELELDGCDLAKIDGLEDLKLLEVLKISRCSITTLDGLKNLPRLRKVQVFSCDLSHLSELREWECEVEICGTNYHCTFSL